VGNSVLPFGRRTCLASLCGIGIVPMIYTFRCNICNTEFDKDFKLKDVLKKSPKPRCPECGGSTRKLINKIPVHYRGDGFTLRKDK
jgi:putative FmdB family regulatory protein